jgi:uncharacterized protein YecT (DUF1311 family)
MRRILTLNLLVSTCIVAQGHIDHIKNQPYLLNFDKSRCDSNSADASSSRACLNLAFQKSDSLLTDVFNEMVKIFEESEWEDTKKQKPAFIELQKQWRSFRDKHCGIYSAYFESSASGNTKGAVYLGCLKELTEDRISELKSMIQLYTQDFPEQ